MPDTSHGAMNQAEVRRPLSAAVERIPASDGKFAERLCSGSSRCILLGVPQGAQAKRLTKQVRALKPEFPIVTVSKLKQVRELAGDRRPEIILLDSVLLGADSLSAVVEQFVTIAPVIVLAEVNNHSQLSRLVASGRVELIGRGGDYVPLAVALIKRLLLRARSTCSSNDVHEQKWNSKLGELFRHEINNRLTGILGNVELVLAHREHLSPQEVQRLQTVVDLAVRLRESVRQISNACEENFFAEASS